MGFKTLAVVNPNSSNGATGKQWPQISDAIAKNCPKFEYVFTNKPGHATDLTRQGLREGYEMIVSVGGDGTNNEVINGFFDGMDPVNPEAVFSHITRGTGGDLRKTTGVPLDIEPAAAVLAGQATKRIDCGRLSMIDTSGNPGIRYFLNIASFGIGGEVDDRVNRTTKALGGFLCFAWASFISMFTYSNKKVRIKIDGDEIGDFQIVDGTVANGRFFGGGMMVAPEAKMDDGLFDIVMLGDFTLVQTLTQMGKIYNGTHIHHPKVKSFQGILVEAESEEVVRLDVDGEQPGRLPAKFEMMPGAIRLKVLDA